MNLSGRRDLKAADQGVVAGSIRVVPTVYRRQRLTNREFDAQARMVFAAVVIAPIAD
jgi:hypothetical protein